MKTIKSKILALTAMAALASATLVAAPRRSASGIQVRAEIDSAVVTMGDRAHVRVQVDIPAAFASTARLVDFPELAPGTEYLEYHGVDVVAADSSSAIENGNRRINFDYTIQAFDPGTVSLPPFAVLASDGSDTAFSGLVTFKVLPVDVDSLETIHPMAGIVAPATKWYDYIPAWLLWVLGGAALVAAGIYAWVLLRKREATAEIRRNPPVPPYELAISRLNTLRSRNLAESGHEKEYYTELVDILRQYLHGRFGINAMEMTSSQIVRALRSNPETRLTADQMRAVLSIADFVKFAKVRPLADDNARAFARATDFVEQTKPAPEPEPEAENAAAKSTDKTSKK